MSLSIGIGIGVANQEFIGTLSDIAKQSGYAIFSSSSQFESDISQCVEALTQLKKWEVVLGVRSPAESNANLAFGVYEELIALQTKGIRPRFFDFCELIAQSACENKVPTLGLIFATEWRAGDRIRVSYGDVKRLETILSLPGHCALNTINLQTGRIDEWDDVPFFYELDCTKVK